MVVEMRYIKLYGEFLKLEIKIMKEYRADFFIGFISGILTQIPALLLIWTVYDNINNVAGWSYDETLLLFGFVTICKGLNHVFFDNIWVIGNNFIRRGTIDIMLTRPISPIFSIIGSKFQKDGISTLILGLYIFISKYTQLYEVSLSGTLLAIVYMIFGTLIIALINFILAMSSFWTTSSNNIIWIVFSLIEFLSYPIIIYSGAVKFLLTWIIPYAIALYYPIVNIKEHGGFNVLVIQIITIILLSIISKLLWNFGLKKYESVGS